MLEEIFNFLEDPDDFLSVIGTCHRWNDIMAYKKTERLFAKVLPILQESNPFPLRTMLTARQINRKWKMGTDEQLELNPYGFQHQAYILEDTEQVTRLLTHANSLPQGANPFLGKYLGNISQDPGVYELFRQLIQQHGTPLKNILMGFTFNTFPHIELASILGGVPNVETLTILGYIQNLDAGGGADDHPLPPLPHLNSVGIIILGMPRENQEDTDDRFQRFVSYLLTAYGEQLSTFQCTKDMLTVDGIGELLPNITQPEFFIRRSTFNHNELQVLSHVGWRLHTLQISDFAIQLSPEFFVALNNFSETLEDLLIHVELEENFNADSLVIFPLLKKLELYINSELRSIPLGMKDKLMKLGGVAPNLEELDITLQNDTLCDVAWGMGMEVMSSLFKKLNWVKFHC
ncbi:unnamed protein product [Orchesella dallaii]